MINLKNLASKLAPKTHTKALLPPVEEVQRCYDEWHRILTLPLAELDDDEQEGAVAQRRGWDAVKAHALQVIEEGLLDKRGYDVGRWVDALAPSQRPPGKHPSKVQKVKALLASPEFLGCMLYAQDAPAEAATSAPKQQAPAIKADPKVNHCASAPGGKNERWLVRYGIEHEEVEAITTTAKPDGPNKAWHVTIQSPGQHYGKQAWVAERHFLRTVIAPQDLPGEAVPAPPRRKPKSTKKAKQKAAKTSETVRPAPAETPAWQNGEAVLYDHKQGDVIHCVFNGKERIGIFQRQHQHGCAVVHLIPVGGKLEDADDLNTMIAAKNVGPKVKVKAARTSPVAGPEGRPVARSKAPEKAAPKPAKKAPKKEPGPRTLGGYSAGSECQVNAFGRWYDGVVVKLARKKVTVAFTTGTGTKREKVVDPTNDALIRPRQEPQEAPKQPEAPVAQPKPVEAPQAAETAPQPQRTINDVDPWPDASEEEWQANFEALSEKEQHELVAAMEASDPDPAAVEQRRLDTAVAQALLNADEDDDEEIVAEAVEALVDGDLEPHEIERCACGKLAAYEAPSGEQICGDCADLHAVTQEIEEAKPIKPVTWKQVTSGDDWPPRDAPVGVKLQAVIESHMQTCATRPELTTWDGCYLVAYDPTRNNEVVWHGTLAEGFGWAGKHAFAASPVLIDVTTWTTPEERPDVSMILAWHENSRGER